MFSVLVPVGPDDIDLVRLGDLLASLRRHERPSDIELILVDDAPSSRLGATLGLEWASTQVIRTPIWRRGRPDAYTAMTVGTICGIRAASPGAAFLLKLDTDALVIGSFSEQLEQALAADDSLGIVGSYDRTCTGATRDWSVWAPVLRRATRRLSLLRSPRKTAAARKVLALAMASGAYELGAHCLGGAYTVSPVLAQRYDLLRWEPWAASGLSEDVVMGVLCAAAGLRMRSMTALDEPFGLAHVGLPGSPEWLLARGHSIVHAVKHPDPRVEADIRKRLQAAAW